MRYGLEETTPPTTYPVTLAQAKAQSHIPTDQDGEDPMIEDIDIPAATHYCEHETHRQFITATLTIRMDEFPRVIWLPRPPAISVTSIKYIDTAGDTQTLSASKYTLDPYRVKARITEAYGEVWPSTRAVVNAVTVIYTAGFGAASTVPAELKKAILMATDGYFYHRTHQTELRLNENMALQRLLAKWAVKEAA